MMDTTTVNQTIADGGGAAETHMLAGGDSSVPICLSVYPPIRRMLVKGKLNHI